MSEGDIRLEKVLMPAGPLHLWFFPFPTGQIDVGIWAGSSIQGLPPPFFHWQNLSSAEICSFQKR